MILLALTPVRENEPEVYAALMQAIGQGKIRLQLVTTVAPNASSILVLNALDGQDQVAQLSTRELSPVMLN